MYKYFRYHQRSHSSLALPHFLKYNTNFHHRFYKNGMFVSFNVNGTCNFVFTHLPLKMNLTYPLHMLLDTNCIMLTNVK